MSGALAGARLLRLSDGQGRVHVGVLRDGEVAVHAGEDMLGVLERGELGDEVERVSILDPDTVALPDPWRLLVPLVAPETWAAGVTYERSRSARMHESRVVDVYDLVYDDERPELFLKDAAGRRTVGPGEEIAVRSDASWSVPEPELAVVLGDERPLAVTVGNDVSSRDIEGRNPLYLPQAKIYRRACALGPALLVPEAWGQTFEIECRILDGDGRELFSEQTSTASMRRSIDELIAFLFRDNPVPAGSVLLTGTGLIPPDEVGLAPGQSVEIRIPGIGVLRNPVVSAAGSSEPGGQANG